MPPKSAAEKMRDYRARLNEKQREDMKAKNRVQQEKCRKKWNQERKEQENERSKERVKKMRRNKSNTRLVVTTPTAPMPSSPSSAYQNRQSYGKAFKRASNALPTSPRKKAAVVKKLSDTFLPTCVTAKSKPEPSELVRQVHSFYESDDISRQLPGKKDFVTVKIDGQKHRLQKRILLSTVMETFKQFKEDHPDFKIGKSKFASLRPPNVLPVSEKDHTVCCCSYHENFDMLVKGIKQKIPELPDVDALISLSVCDEKTVNCSLGECDLCKDVSKLHLIDDSIHLSMPCTYMQWKNNEKVSVSSSLAEAKRELLDQLYVMRRHCFIAKIQLKQVKQMKQNLNENEAMLHIDFAENFQIQQQDEIMSAHWVTKGVTVYTAVVNTQNGATSFAVVSDELDHNKYSVATFNRAILEMAKSVLPNDIKTLHIVSDGAGSQFKNRFTLSNILKPHVIHPDLEEVDWTFFGTAHGKGPIDGVGGTVKRAVWRRILRRQVVINTAKEFADVAADACPNIKIIFISGEEVAAVRREMDNLWDNAEPQNIPQIRQSHFFKKGSKCELLKAPITPYFSEFQRDVIPTSTIIFAAEDHASSWMDTIVTQTLTTDVKNPLQIGLEQYFAVDYVDKFYIGRVISRKQDGFFQMKFLHHMFEMGEPVFNWPRHDDVDTVHESAIFHGPISLSGTLKDFRIVNYKEIEEAFKNLK